MLRAKTNRPAFSADGLRFAVVGSRYNQLFTDAMVNHARRALKQAGAAPADVKIVRVPGAFEIPVVVKRLLNTNVFDAVIALGVIIRGETAHADLVAGTVTDQLARMSVEHGVPVIHEVLLLANEQQAHARCIDAKHNRGTEAALTAIEMARLVREL